MPYFERAGEPRLHYELDDYTDPWKKAPTILLQHGYARSTKFWRACVPYLARFYRVLRLDLRGFGQSDTSFNLKTGLNLAAYVKDFNELFDHLGIDSVHYCGESSAGTLGMAFAAECPERVRTLTVISSPVAMTEEDKKSALAGHPDRVTALTKMGTRGWIESSNAGRRFPADADPRLLAWTLDEMGKSDVNVMIASFIWTSNVDAEPYLPKIKAPVLAIYPQSGVITKEEHIDLLRAKVRDIDIVRIPLNAHSLQIIAPATCAEAVLHFIARHDGIACREQ